MDSPTNKYLSLKSISGSDDGLDRSEAFDPRQAEARSVEHCTVDTRPSQSSPPSPYTSPTVS